jgi:ribosomal protein L40E
MKCPKCQAENPEESEYCSLCFTRFQTQIRSSEIEEAAKKASEKHKGSKLRCPSCNDLSPMQAPFCLRCGFVFEDLEAIMVSEEEVERINLEKGEMIRKDLEDVSYEPITITAESDGAEVMRNIIDILGKGCMARLHTHGRNATTYAMKIIALIGGDLSREGRELSIKVRLFSEDAITDLDDLELEILLKGEQTE